MKGHIPEDIIEEIKIRAHIVDIVSEYVSLKNAGKNYVGLCPFHSEKTPSFTVNPEKQIFYCFGCGEGGNVISFIMKIGNMSFPESIRHLADRFGIAIPVKKTGVQQRMIAGEQNILYRINTLAARYFSRNLSSMDGKDALQYLNDRGIDHTVVRKFGIGYSYDGWSFLKNYLTGKKIPLNSAEKAGLIISNKKGQLYDRFRGRIIFPIEDMSGNVVGFGGRIIGKGEPKYMNSPESPVYVKRKTLYGLYHSRSDIQKKNEAIIVEGYFDFLSLWAAGITNVVATLGTALTKEHVGLIRRLTKNMAIVFDPDEAGRSAVERGIALSLEEEMNARIVVLPEGEDPDIYVREHGRGAIDDAIQAAPSMVTYYVEHIIKGGNTPLAEKLESVKAAVEFIGRIRDPIQRNLFVKTISEKLGIDQGILKSEVVKMTAQTRNSQKETLAKKNSGTALDMVEAGLIGMIMDDPDKIQVVLDENVLDYFLSKELRNVGEFLIESFNRGAGKQLYDIITEFPDVEIRERFLKMAMLERPEDQSVVDQVFRDAIKKIRRRWYQNRREILQRELLRAQQAGDTDLLNKLIMEKGELLEEEKNLRL